MTKFLCLGAVTELFAGMLAGLACVVLGLLVFVTDPDTTPRADRDPVIRFDMAIVLPPEVNADPPIYHPIRDRLEQAGLFAVIANSTLPTLAWLTAPTGSTPESRAAPGMAVSRGDDPRLDLPELGPDKPFRSKEASKPPTVPHLANVTRALPTVIANSTLPTIAWLTAPTGSAPKSRAAPGMAASHGDDPRLDLPELGPDKPFRSKGASKPPTVPHLANVTGALPTVRAALFVGLSAVPRSDGDIGSTGPEHFLQGGYFAHRQNAVGLSAKLVKAGLNVLMEQTTNRAGKTRWLVLVGPYHQKKDAMRARHSAPKLLAGAFHKINYN